jgi:hypothetical protein
MDINELEQLVLDSIISGHIQPLQQEIKDLQQQINDIHTAEELKAELEYERAAVKVIIKETPHDPTDCFPAMTAKKKYQQECLEEAKEDAARWDRWQEARDSVTPEDKNKAFIASVKRMNARRNPT